jgi:hypothetical protein
MVAFIFGPEALVGNCLSFPSAILKKTEVNAENGGE